MYGFYRLAAAVPVLKVADVEFNAGETLNLYRRAAAENAAAVVFPELGLTGYTCGDLFFQRKLQQKTLDAARELARNSSATLLVFGLPLLHRDALYNVAAVAQNGKLLALVPKTILPNYREFYEKRHFRSGRELVGATFQLADETIPLGPDLIFAANPDAVFGIELCEDLWAAQPPSTGLALAGAKVILNLSAGTELSAKAAYRRELVRQQSARLLAAYALAGAGVHESTTDAVFGGHALIADNGRLAVENRRFDRASSLIYADVDLQRLGAARNSESSFHDCAAPACRHLQLEPVPESPDLAHAGLTAHPFVPPESERDERCAEIFDIQCAGLAKRIEHTGARKLVLGISGGLDSTLALLVSARTCELLGLPPASVLGVQLPGFGTTRRTHHNAEALCRELGVETRVIDIVPAALRHFQDLGHDPAVQDTTYENTQARERTQLLMDLANQLGGLVVGTGDLSEIALGWSTYNGDHMSMYSVNCSVPKTLIRYLIAWQAAHAPEPLRRVLEDVIATPVSPELLPPAPDGAIRQETEELVGPYELHDFFLYHFLKYGAEPEKIDFLAQTAFADRYPAQEITRWLRVFLKRFFRQQFKRNCSPDGPKVGSIALSPRGDWRMPSDATDGVFLNW